MEFSHGSYSHFLQQVRDRWIKFCSIILKSSLKFPITQNLWSLAQAYPSMNHWWSIIVVTLPSIARVVPILLNTRTQYTVTINWYTFTHIHFWSSTSRERPVSLIQCMTQREVCSYDYLINKWTPRYRASV